MTKNMRDKLFAIRKTLESLNIVSTYDNLDKLLGCMQTIDSLLAEGMNEKEAKEDDQVHM